MSFKPVSDYLGLVRNFLSNKAVLPLGFRDIPYVYLPSIVTIGGLKGSGKSTFLEQIRRYASQHDNIVVLSFEYEMSPTIHILRTLMANKNKTIEELTESDLEGISLPNYYVDTTTNDPSSISYQIKKYCDDPSKIYLITIDNTLLLEGGGSLKDRIDRLYLELLKVKILLEGMGIRICVIVATHMNREMCNMERIARADGHYPRENDFLNTSSPSNLADYCFVFQLPADFLPPHTKYGPNLLPTHTENGLPIVYLHKLKDRFLGSDTEPIPLVGNFKNSTLEDYVRDDER